MATKICILGAGPGGYVAAVRAAQLGADVTLIEKENPGGTCLNWGCIPSKVMITAAELMERLRKAAAFGIEVGGEVRPRMDLLMARKEKVIADHIQGLFQLFERHRIRYVAGSGKILGQGALEVTPPDGAPERLAWDHLVLATGTRPLELPGMAFDGERILSSNHALSLTAVPRSVAILGGGVIGCEFASLLSALGSEVTVIEALPRLLPLPSVDDGVSKVLQREFKKRKIRLLLGRTALRAEAGPGAVRVIVGPSDGAGDPAERERQGQPLEVEKLLVCVGRAPNTGGIGLETVGVELDTRGWVLADRSLRTGRHGVWAIGDVLGPSRVMLAHAASVEGEAAAENIMGAAREMDYDAVPGAIFTHPEVAMVGLTQAQAELEGIPVRSETVLMRAVGKAHVIDEIAGEAKIVFHRQTGRILGAHLVGAHATDLVAEAALAVKNRLTVSDLVDTVHAHPTLAEVLREAALKAAGRPLHA